MRTTIALLVVAVLLVAWLGGCRARDDAGADSAGTDGVTPDSAAADGTAADSGNVVRDAAPQSSAAPPDTRRLSSAVRRAGDTSRDAALPPDDSIRALRPDLPQVTPEKRPRTWRGFKLPEEMPVRAPIESIKRVEQAPDSMMKGDSTKPPPPER